MYTISAPGKLFIAGEWAILELGNPGIVSSIDRKVFVEIKEIEDKEKNIYITLDEIGAKGIKSKFDNNTLNFINNLSEYEKEYIKFVKTAIEVALQYINNFKAFEIKTWGKGTSFLIDKEIIKIGFGSSAACVVATIASILKLHGYDITSEEAKEKIYKLATIAHYLAQGKLGSGFDVAASTYGGIFVYYRFDPLWLLEKIDIKNGKIEYKEDLREIVKKRWPCFKIEKLNIPKDFHLLVGWTGEKASTTEMIKKMNEWRKKGGEDEYKRICNEIKHLIEDLIEAWKKEEKEKIIELIRKNEDYLRYLGEKSGVPIETEKLRKLVEISNSLGAAGKLSGAGGGDCGIAISFSSKVLEKIRIAWKEAGIHALDISLEKDGVKEVKELRKEI